MLEQIAKEEQLALKRKKAQEAIDATDFSQNSEDFETKHKKRGRIRDDLSWLGPAARQSYFGTKSSVRLMKKDLEASVNPLLEQNDEIMENYVRFYHDVVKNNIHKPHRRFIKLKSIFDEGMRDEAKIAKVKVKRQEKEQEYLEKLEEMRQQLHPVALPGLAKSGIRLPRQFYSSTYETTFENTFKIPLAGLIHEKQNITDMYQSNSEYGKQKQREQHRLKVKLAKLARDEQAQKQHEKKSSDEGYDSDNQDSDANDDDDNTDEDDDDQRTFEDDEDAEKFDPWKGVPIINF